ncbi:MAG: gliding motility protein GldN [Bacteroidales bacterium]|jgi:gliding motility associated protien GldN|nr:gliding motility protein GldN [Bacteroidales bacterium]MBQ2488380.1 gliding motility protein GldN [Bacteroidales bacterium]MBQ5533316.1 gliding motility protein GldN [Bacteroidales bacterium]
MKAIKLAILLVLFTSLSFAQVIESEAGSESTPAAPKSTAKPIRAPIDRPWVEQNLADNKPIALQSINRDYLKDATLIWRVLDLREKMNHPLYFPTEVKGNWRSLMQIILDAIDSSENNPEPLRVYTDENINIPMSSEELRASMGETKRIELLNDWGDPIGDSTIFIAWGAKDVFQYILKECWYVDNQRSMLDVRIMALCPMFWYEPQTDVTSEEADEDMPGVTNRRWRQFSWIDYNEIRPFLARNEVFNTQNFAQNRTFDDLFLQRRFSSFIKAKGNVYDHREINQYIVNGLDQILEAEKIKNEIREKEHDMWEF